MDGVSGGGIWGSGLGVRSEEACEGRLPSSPSLTPADQLCSFGVGGCEVD